MFLYKRLYFLGEINVDTTARNRIFEVCGGLQNFVDLPYQSFAAILQFVDIMDSTGMSVILYSMYGHSLQV